jgi:hypothetical protein
MTENTCERLLHEVQVPKLMGERRNCMCLSRFHVQNGANEVFFFLEILPSLCSYVGIRSLVPVFSLFKYKYMKFSFANGQYPF